MEKLIRRRIEEEWYEDVPRTEGSPSMNHDEAPPPPPCPRDHSCCDDIEEDEAKRSR